MGSSSHPLMIIKCMVQKVQIEELEKRKEDALPVTRVWCRASQRSLKEHHKSHINSIVLISFHIFKTRPISIWIFTTLSTHFDLNNLPKCSFLLISEASQWRPKLQPKHVDKKFYLSWRHLGNFGNIKYFILLSSGLNRKLVNIKQPS